MSAPSLLAALAEAPSARKKPAQHEFQHQCALFDWARNPAVERSLPGIAFMSASLNGVPLPPALARKMSRAGMLAGEYDVRLPVPRGAWIGFILEMKFGKNDRSDKQRWYGAGLEAEGWKIGTYWDWEDARRDIILYLNLPRPQIIAAR
jgi:hypothetical protein